MLHLHIGAELSSEDVEMLSPLLLDESTQELVNPTEGFYLFSFKLILLNKCLLIELLPFKDNFTELVHHVW